MAKTIKKIACPQCESYKITMIKEDYYLCNNCQTNFFLDTNDITINHNHKFDAKHVTHNADIGKKIIKVLLGLVVLFIVYKALQVFLFEAPKPTHNNVMVAEPKKAAPKVETTRMIQPYITQSILIAVDDEHSVETVVALYKNNDQYMLYTILFDPIAGKEIKRTAMDVNFAIKGAGMHSDYDVQLLPDLKYGALLIVNKYFLYYFDKVNQQFVSVDADYFIDYPEFTSGIASIDYHNFYKTLEIVNNLGQSYAFFPHIKKVYLKDKAHEVFNLKLPNATTVTGYKFSTASYEFPDEIIQLIEYQQQYDKYYPAGYFKFQWTKDHGGSGVFTDRSPYQKVLLLPYPQKQARIISYRDFTPKRQYTAHSEILAVDDESIMLALKLTVADNETYTLQKLSRKDGSIIWSKKTDWLSLGQVQQVNDQVFFQINHKINVVLDMDGNVLSEVDPSAVMLTVDI